MLINKIKNRRYFYSASLKTYVWDPTLNEVINSTIKKEKDFTQEEKNLKYKEYKIEILMIGGLLFGLGALGFLFNWIAGICLMIGLPLFGLSIWALSLYNDIKYPYEEYLGVQDGDFEREDLKEIFKEDIKKLEKNRLKQIQLAKKWRKTHPLEEKIRLALNKNSNDIADLIRYCIDVKGEIIPPSPEEAKDKIIVKYLNNK